jgi:V/A-type H+-transporting ATPase subunit I
MLKPARMSKLRVIVLDQYLEEVVREFSRLGSVQVLDVRNSPEDMKNLEPATENQASAKSSELLGRVYYLIDVLGISEDRDFFGSLKKEPKKIGWRGERSSKQLARAEELISEMEKAVIKKEDAIVRLGEEEASLEPKKRMLEALSRLNVKAGWLGESRFLYLIAGQTTPEELDRLALALEKEGIEHIIKESNHGEKISLLLLTPKSYKQDIDRIIEAFNFDRFVIDQERSTGSLKDVQKRLDEISKEKKHLEKGMEEDKRKYEEKLLALREVVQIEKDIAETSTMTAKTKRVYMLEGWVSDKKLGELRTRIEEASDGHAMIKVVKPKKGEVIPTKFDNPKIFQPFEVLVETFGMPAYKELDPTPILALTFPLFYGLMFGDLGHGLILALLGLMVIKIAKSVKGVRSLGIIILICGLFSMFFGLMYGELFGMGAEVQKETLNGFHLTPLLTYQEGDEILPQINPMEHPIGFLQMAVLIGVIHIGSGMVLALINLVREKKYLPAVAGPLPKIWLYYGLVYLFYTNWIDFTKWGANIPLVILLIPVPLLLIVLSEVIKHLPHLDMRHLPTLLGEGAFEAFDTILNFLSNSISYSRIFALALVHGGLFIALFEVAKLFMAVPFIGGIMWFLVILAGTAGILALESLIVFLHSLRLHYYEWFTKFYAADGAKFVPFKEQRVYTKVEE